MFFQRKACLLLLLSTIFATTAAQTSPDKSKSRWETDIRAFENWDAKNSVPENAVLFVGSSSIRMWKTSKSFPDIPVINRGFGGSQIADSIEHAHRIILPYKPAMIILYAGDNDIAAGKSSQQVLSDYKEFVKLIHKSLPKTAIAFMSIKPSKSRWQLWPKMSKANSMIKEFSKDNKRLFYIDGASPLLNSNQVPNDKYFKSDNLHLSEEGYKIWTNLLEPINILKSINPDKQDVSKELAKKGMRP